MSKCDSDAENQPLAKRISKPRTLQKACEQNDLETLKYFVSNEAVRQRQLNRIDIHGWTPLHHAINNNFVECVRVLLQQPGINLKLKTIKKGETPLAMACRKADTNIEIIKLLVKDNQPTNADYNKKLVPPSHLAIFSNRLDVLEALVEGGANVNECNSYGSSCLHIACSVRPSNGPILEFLLSKSELDTNYVNRGGNSSLYFACRFISDSDLKIKVIGQLLSRQSTIDSPVVYSPMAVIEHYMGCLESASYFENDPTKICHFWLTQTTHLNPAKNSKYLLIKFLQENYTLDLTKMKHIREQYFFNEYLIFYLEFFLHDKLWHKLQKNESIFDQQFYFIIWSMRTNVDYRHMDDNELNLIYSLNSIFFVIMRRACESDDHFCFAVEFLKELKMVYFSEIDLQCVINWWLLNNSNLKQLRRASNLLEICSCEFGLEIPFKNVLRGHNTMFDRNKNETLLLAALRLMAPYCLETWVVDCEFRTITTKNINAWQNGLYIFAKSLGYKKPQLSYPSSLKSLCRKQILQSHKHHWRGFCKYVSTFGLPKVLMDYLCFRTDDDLCNLFNR